MERSQPLIAAFSSVVCASHENGIQSSGWSASRQVGSILGDVEGRENSQWGLTPNAFIYFARAGGSWALRGSLTGPKDLVKMAVRHPRG